MFTQHVARRVATQKTRMAITTQCQKMSTTTTQQATGSVDAAVAAGIPRKRIRLQDGDYREKLAVYEQKQFDNLINSTYQRTTNYMKGEMNVPTSTRLPPVYPFRPHAVHPITGEYVTRPGDKQPGVLDLDTTLSSQILHYKRRMVTHHMNMTNPERVIGDQAIYQSRVESNKERLTVLFDDNVRPFLSRHTRTSPIYKDVIPELRTPRVPLPADTHTHISPTAGVLHAYRMHWIRMYLTTKKRRENWKKLIPFSNVYDYDPKVIPVQGANNAGLQEFMHLVKGVAAARNTNFVGGDTMAFIAGVKKILPIVAKVDKVEVIKIRRRKK